MELQDVTRGANHPWKPGRLETGCWQFDGTHVLELIKLLPGGLAKVVDSKEQLLAAFEPFQGEYVHHPEMDAMLGYTFRIIEVLPEGVVGLRCCDGVVRYFPPAVLTATDHGEYSIIEDEAAPDACHLEEQLTEEPAEEPALEVSVPPVPTALLEKCAPESMENETPAQQVIQSGVVLECWSKVDESDLERVERAVREYMDYMSAASITVPENLQRVGKCAAEHKNCFVYRFGTRKVHMSTRVAQDGRLSLVVRCGGGFMDFVEFVRRNGSLQQLKLQKQAPAQGATRFSSVLSGGRLKVKPVLG